MSMFSRAFHSVTHAVENIIQKVPAVGQLATAGASLVGGPIGGGLVQTLIASNKPRMNFAPDDGSADVPSLPSLPSAASGGTSDGNVQVAMAGGVLAGALGRGAVIAGNVIKSASGKILGWLLPNGGKIMSREAVALAREIGLTSAAAAIGASVVDLAEVIFHHHKHGRRHRRGITGADIRTTGRTIRRVERVHSVITRLASRAVHHRRGLRGPVISETIRVGKGR